ncbi:hypothetical protein C7974DRAFT_454348 [Boeremia exigua]|uniref:uncharacterized protein n=1 Tax=Boeremia exigua TaxID=749465 RepID=UPI001E8DEF95|nr:uncharacterized protein C7974DRAFT_454348 [Boeremia exigua]KAH6629557.1 hypothetical protein C7974DRAFT_454348 [Boeremia exigua]
MAQSSSSAECELPVEILTLSQYKVKFGASQGNGEPTVYDASSERYPNDDWYALEHDKINSGIHDLCLPLLRAVRKHSSNDVEVSNLNATVQTANIIPRGQQFYVAFLGEQGTGKSSLINSILDRDIVFVSPSSSACTAYPTFITHKVGASDDTKESDIRVQYFSEEEIRECSQEQARRYREAFPCKHRDAPDHDVQALLEIGMEEDLSDGEDDEVPISTSTADDPCRKSIRPSILRGAKTAMSFFNIIFQTEHNKEQESFLQDQLDYMDIEDGVFADLCVVRARSQLSERNLGGGFAVSDTIKDEILPEFQEIIDKVWPLIKSVRIETGHVLLRNNVCLLDLPGYGDDNHIRTATIDKFRLMAHFEIVVAPTSRVVSSVVQERYLSRSIRRLGARNTLLVTNKSDQLLDNLEKQINKLEEAPFPLFKQYLANIKVHARQGTENKCLLVDYRDYLLKEARMAYIQREKDIVSLQLQDRGVDILSVSARQYSICTDAEQDDEKPKLTPAATGIPQLRRYLFHLPAQTNYRTLHYHVFETLPDIVRQIQRILEKFGDDEGYAQMREYLTERLLQVHSSIRMLATSLPTERVSQPFIEGGVKSRINTGLKAVVQTLASPFLYYPTFSKMLKENGIPVNGAGLGRNLNQEILDTMVEFIHSWRDKMQTETEDIALKLDEPVQAVLNDLRNRVQGYEGDPELKSRATELLDTTTRRIAMAYGKMAALLQSKLREVHFMFSNETNVKCPIALEMMEIYRSVLLQQLIQPGPGSYARQRAHLIESLIAPDWPKPPFSDVMEQKIANTQVESWKDCCEQYVEEATALLQVFARSIDELLDTGAQLTSDHRRVREQLEALLPQFKKQLYRVQSRFPGTDTSGAFVSNKRKAGGERAATQPPTSWNDVKRSKSSVQAIRYRGVSEQHIGKLRERFLSNLQHESNPVIKREPGL